MITQHQFSDTDLISLAVGTETDSIIRRLRDVQQSLRIMSLLHITQSVNVTRSVNATDRDILAFRGGYKLLARLRGAHDDSRAWLLDLPHLAAWQRRCLTAPEAGNNTGLGHFAGLAAAAAIRVGMPFELEVPVLGQRVLLPGLGSIAVNGEAEWVRLHCDGERVSAGDIFEADWHLLVPDDGSVQPVTGWYGTPLIRADADELTWRIFLETSDPFLDLYSAPMASRLSPEDLWHWRLRIQAAWKILVRHHRAVAESIATGISVIVPIAPKESTDLVSATSQAVFGAIATSWPPDPLIMAETLVHEFHHVKLVGLMDTIPLVEAGEEKVYAPWRQDPRPTRGLLQGIYAHLGIARFWNSQRQVETGQDNMLRAHVAFARWRRAVSEAIEVLIGGGCLTPAGMRFARILQDQGRQLESEHVPVKAQQMADEVALDHRLIWQLRHLKFEATDIERLVVAFRRGAPRPMRRPLPMIDDTDVRKVGSTILSRPLNARYLNPARYIELRIDETTTLKEADTLLLDGRPDAAAEAYRRTIMDTADPQPDAWIGLSLALYQLPESPISTIFADQLPLMFDIYTSLGHRSDPLRLAEWLA